MKNTAHPIYTMQGPRGDLRELAAPNRQHAEAHLLIFWPGWKIIFDGPAWRYIPAEIRTGGASASK